MAKNDMIANHKRGLVNSTLGNGFRGGLTGAAIFGGAAAAITLATGGLALPLVLGAAAAGGALFGGLNAIGGALRWGAEFVGGVVGINRKQRNNNMGYDGQQQQQQQGMGMVEGVVALVGAAMGMQSMKNKISNAFGSNDRGNSQEQFTPKQQESQTAAFSRPGYPPEVPGILQDKVQRNDRGGVELHLTREDMANPNMREAVKNYGKAQASYRDSLMNSNDIGAQREAVEMQRTARFVDEQGVRDPSRMPGFNKETGTYIVCPEHLMNDDVQRQMQSEGKSLEKQVAREVRDERRHVRDEMRDLTNTPMIRRTENPFAEPSVSAQAAPAQTTPAPEAPSMRPDTPATQAFGANMRDLAQSATAQRAATPSASQQSTTPSGLILDTNVQKALNDVRSTAQANNVQHKGDASVVRAGSAGSGEQKIEQVTR